MERLTERDGDMVWLKSHYGGLPVNLEPCDIHNAFDGTKFIRQTLARLAAYEDTGYVPGQFEDAMDAMKAHLFDVEQELKAYKNTGLTPDGVKTLKEKFRQLYDTFDECCPDDPVHFQGLLDKLKGWRQAEKAGRLVVLPCKVGDEVYFPVEGRWDSAIIEHIEVYTNKVMFTWVQYDIGPEINELWDEGNFTLGDIGKTVFLTRKEAEEALGKEAEHGD